ncbi:hypothetical protein T12_15953 [Trichinella patagoniensis]|uniref:Uncharacterized protein n=1 Tax=Trichinella patagoniensis TaxID=990121 RepID=A0A0V0ZAW2_9BILA|nr:hypothetical protein T12_15953 [Trichinella patagoniensis]
MGVTLASSLHSEKKSTKRCQSLSQSYNGIGRIFFFKLSEPNSHLCLSFFADGVTIRCQREPVVADSLNQSKHRLGAERAGAERLIDGPAPEDSQRRLSRQRHVPSTSKEVQLRRANSTAYR